MRTLLFIMESQSSFVRQHFLINDDDRAALLVGFQITRQTKPFEIVAWVQLPDHLHC